MMIVLKFHIILTILVGFFFQSIQCHPIEVTTESEDEIDLTTQIPWITDVDKRYSTFSQPNDGPDFGMEDPNLFQGDILADNSSEVKTAVRVFQLWPLGIVPYSVDLPNFLMLSEIRAAMNEIEEKTCIRFRPRLLSRDFIQIGSGSGCYSAVGKRGGPQVLSLGRGCSSHNTILHELLHAIGFEHMHSHRDRDLYLRIRYENIPRDKWRQFEVVSLIGFKTIMPFDFESVMLYGPRTFAQGGKISMESKVEGQRVLEMHEKGGLSKGDADAINKLYMCRRIGADGLLG